MDKKIDYDLNILSEVISDLRSIKGDMPLDKSNNYSSFFWDDLETGTSKGDTISALEDFYIDTIDRAKEINRLVINIQSFVINAEKQIRSKDEKLAKDYKK